MIKTTDLAHFFLEKFCFLWFFLRVCKVAKQGDMLRIDKFLNCVNITKRRAISEDMCKSGVVSINDTIVKPAKVVKIGDIISIKYLKKVSKYEVLEIPTTKTIPKTAQDRYVKELSDV